MIINADVYDVLSCWIYGDTWLWFMMIFVYELMMIFDDDKWLWFDMMLNDKCLIC